MPITLKVVPSRSSPGRKIMLSGVAPADGKRMTARLHVVFPDNSAKDVQATLTPTGDYSIPFAGTVQPGLYRVSAYAPDGAAGDTASFRILTGEQTAGAASVEWQHLLDVEDSAVRVLRRMVDTLPESPPKTEALDTLARLETRLKRRAQDLSLFKQAAGAIEQLLTKYPTAAPAMAPVLDRMNDWVSQSSDERIALNEKLIKSAEESVVCERINAAGEGTAVAGAIMNLAGTAVGIMGEFFRDWLADKFTNLLPSDLAGNSTFTNIATQLIKNGKSAVDALADYGTNKTRGVGAGVAMLPGVLFDLAGMFTGSLFDKYCERFTGPFDATLHVEFNNSPSGKVWWTYDITLRGKLTLRYGKGATSAARLKGEFVGGATELKLWEDALRVFKPELMAGTQMYKRILMPVIAPYTEMEGSYVGSLLPGTFFIPVEGELVGRKLSLQVDKARTDFEGTEARVLWVVMGVRTAMLPIALTNKFPFQGAHTVLRGGLSGQYGPATANAPMPPRSFDVRNVGKVMLFDETVTFDKVKGPVFEVSTRVHLKACNPSCP